MGVALEPANFTITDTITIPSDWDIVAVDNVNENFSQWEYTLPADIEAGFYELYVKGFDANDVSGRSEIVWRGLIDMVSPVITVTAQHTSQDGLPVTEYIFTFSDFILDDSSYDQPCAAGDLVAQSYNDANLPHDGLPYEVSATCQVPGHESDDVSITVCDLVGLCTTEIVSFEPTAISLAAFDALAQPDGSVLVTWETAVEIDNVGFNIYRSSGSVFDPATVVQVNGALIPSEAVFGQGASYTMVDEAAPAGVWHYFLEDVDFSGNTALHGPVSANTSAPTSAGLTGLQGGQPLIALASILIILAGLLVSQLVLMRRRSRYE